MGCHTWFARPLIKEEFGLMKEYAPTSIMNACGATEENIRYGLYDEYLYDRLMRSYTQDIPCVYGEYWWELGYGSDNPQLLKDNDGDFFTHTVRGDTRLYVDIDKYNDIFRVKNYPRKTIHNKRELRKFLRKKYFTLTEYQCNKISKFFKLYPDGIIYFG